MQAASYRYRPSAGNRVTAAVLALTVCALILLMLIRMGLVGPGAAGVAEKLTAITFRGQSEEKKTEKQKPVKTEQRHEERQAVVKPEVTPPVQPVPKAVPVVKVPWIQLSRDQFAASDISKIAKHPAESSESQASSSSSSGSYGPGEGPGGAKLYNAEWYREPTRAEMVTYMPQRDVSGGWAMIACKTIEHYHVENCQELGESPPGSGLARALRLASWQFLVRPPRLEGKPMLGTWVRIRFDFTAAVGSQKTALPGADIGGDTRN